MRRPLRNLGGLAIVLVLALLVALPMTGARAAGGGAGATHRLSMVEPLDAAGVAGAVTWNGASVASSSSISSALTTNFGSSINLVYTWRSASGAGAPFNISDARLQMFYFGFALATRDVINSNPRADLGGTFNMSWDPGVLQWVLAGTYGVTASLLAPNGTTMWSEAFFVRVTAPGGVGAVLPILLILIALYEVYSLARSGRQAVFGKPAPASSPPASPPPGPAGSEAPSAPAASTEPSPGSSGAPPKEGA